MAKNAKLEEAFALLGDLTAEQKAQITEAVEQLMPDKELSKKFGELGVNVDGETFTAFLKTLAEGKEEKEEKVFKQELSAEDLEAVAGGRSNDDGYGCVVNHRRDIYGKNGFPNCAATVEDGSWCDRNDACLGDAVVYSGMDMCSWVDCSKAWR